MRKKRAAAWMKRNQLIEEIRERARVIIERQEKAAREKEQTV